MWPCMRSRATICSLSSRYATHEKTTTTDYRGGLGVAVCWSILTWPRAEYFHAAARAEGDMDAEIRDPVKRVFASMKLWQGLRGQQRDNCNCKTTPRPLQTFRTISGLSARAAKPKPRRTRSKPPALWIRCTRGWLRQEPPEPCGSAVFQDRRNRPLCRLSARRRFSTERYCARGGCKFPAQLSPRMAPPAGAVPGPLTPRNETLRCQPRRW